MPGFRLNRAFSWRGFLYLLAYCVLPNLPVWIFQRQVEVMLRGYINVEALMVGLLALFLPPTVIFLLLVVEMGAALIYLVCHAYLFSLEDFFSAARSFAVLPSSMRWHIYLALAVVVTLAAITAFGIPRPKGKVKTWTAASMLTLCLFLVGIDTLHGYNRLISSDYFSAVSRLALSPLVTLTKRQADFRREALMVQEASLIQGRQDELASASMHAMKVLGSASGAGAPNVVLILVESWGGLRNPRLASALVSGYNQQTIQSKYSVTYGMAPFIGPTVAGEARELCHSQMGFEILNISQARSQACIPAYFHKHGYKDIAVHGYMGKMFRRKDWYPVIGFDQLWFLHSLRQAGLPLCNGAFPGICDSSIAQWIGKALLPASASQPEFIYWVTLNSHLPVPLEPADGSCPAEETHETSKAFCSWFQLIERVHQSVQQLAETTQGRPTIFVLVGDHAPPFVEPNLRGMFSQTEVPYVILTPKTWTAPVAERRDGELQANRTAKLQELTPKGE